MLERLEGREVPAVATFTGADFAVDPEGKWSNANNWLNNVKPNNGDDVLFAQAAANHASRMDIAGLSLNKLTLDTLYTGTLELANNLQVGTASTTPAAR